MINMLVKVGWKKPFSEKCTPILPISGWMGDNLITKSTKMDWWSGVDVTLKPKGGKAIHIDTLLDALNDMVTIPERDTSKLLRMPVSGVYKIKGTGDVITGRVEQGKVVKDMVCHFVPTHSASKECTGKIFSVEMHHKKCEEACPGDNVGLNVKNLSKENMPKVGDVMVDSKGSGEYLKQVATFTAQVQVLDHPGELKPGYSPIAFVRTGRSAAKISSITWKIGKETQGAKAESPPHLKANDMAEVVFTPIQPFVCEAFDACEGLGRVAIMEGASVVMLGKAVSVTYKVDEKKK
jgi:elongation factor 1-alpha